MGDSHPPLPPEIDDLLSTSRRGARWMDPPEDLVRRADSAFAGGAEPLQTPRLKTREWTPVDVRSLPVLDPVALGESNAHTISRGFDGGEVGLLVVPPEGDGRWRIQGTIWLQSKSDRTLRVLLVHRDHVLHSLAIQSDELFEIEEFTPAGWSVEIHVPLLGNIVIEDPTH